MVFSGCRNVDCVSFLVAERDDFVVGMEMVRRYTNIKTPAAEETGWMRKTTNAH